MLLGLSRSQLYELIRSGRLQTVKEGRVRLIPATAIDAYVSLLTSEARQIPVAMRRNPGEGGLHWEESRQRWFATVYVGYSPEGSGARSRSAPGRRRRRRRNSSNRSATETTGTCSLVRPTPCETPSSHGSRMASPNARNRR